MFIQSENLFGEIMPVSYSPLVEFSRSSKLSNIWRVYLGIFILIGVTCTPALWTTYLHI